MSCLDPRDWWLACCLQVRADPRLPLLHLLPGAVLQPRLVRPVRAVWGKGLELLTTITMEITLVFRTVSVVPRSLHTGAVNIFIRVCTLVQHINNQWIIVSLATNYNHHNNYNNNNHSAVWPNISSNLWNNRGWKLWQPAGHPPRRAGGGVPGQPRIYAYLS